MYTIYAKVKGETPEEALKHMRQAATQYPRVLDRLRRLALLVAYGQPLRISGTPTQQQAFMTALSTLAARHLEARGLARVPITPEGILKEALLGTVQCSLHDHHGQVKVRYTITRQGERVLVRAGDRQVHQLSVKDFLYIMTTTFSFSTLVPSAEAAPASQAA